MEPQVKTGAFECGFLRNDGGLSLAFGGGEPSPPAIRLPAGYCRDGKAAISVVSHRAPGSSASGQRQRQVSP